MTPRLLLRPLCWLRGHSAAVRPRQPPPRDRIDTYQVYCPRCGFQFHRGSFR